MTVKLNRAVARKVLETIDAGLVAGRGVPEPGKMCVEAAVCYALGLPHGDNPDCVSPILRNLKIALNDQAWADPAARARGLRRLGIAQLGSTGMDEKEFLRRLSEFTIGVIVPRVLRSAIKAGADPSLEDFAVRCEKEKSYPAAAEAADAAYDAAYDAAAYAFVATYAAAAHAAARAASGAYAAAEAKGHAAAYSATAAVADAEREVFAEGVVQILVEMNIPGTKWLDLTTGDPNDREAQP